MKAAISATSPPSTQTPRIKNGVVTWRATTDGFMKIPEPMMPPITIMVASKRPRRRASPGCDLAEESETSMVAIPLFEEETTIHEITLTSTNSPWCDFVKFRGSILFGCDFYFLNRRMLFLISAYHRIFAALPDNFLLSLIGVSKN
jgi:hypothetical protein